MTRANVWGRLGKVVSFGTKKRSIGLQGLCDRGDIVQRRRFTRLVCVLYFVSSIVLWPRRRVGVGDGSSQPPSRSLLPVFRVHALHAHVRVPVAPPLRTSARLGVTVPAHDVRIVIHAIETILLVTRVAPVPVVGRVLSPVSAAQLRLPTPTARHVRISVHPIAILQQITRFTHVQPLEIQRLGPIPIRVFTPRPDAVALGALLRVSRNLQRILPRHLLLLVTPLTQILPFGRPNLRTHPLSRRLRPLARRAGTARRRLDAAAVLALITPRTYRPHGRIRVRSQSSNVAHEIDDFVLIIAARATVVFVVVAVDARLARLARRAHLVVARVKRAPARAAPRARRVEDRARARRRRRDQRVGARGRVARHARRRLAGPFARPETF